MGNLGLFPSSLDTYVGGFKNSSSASGAKPFWVEGAREIMAQRGLLKENALWGDASSRTWLAAWKSLLEGLRKQPLISGYQWWTLYLVPLIMIPTWLFDRPFFGRCGPFFRVLVPVS